MGTMYLQSSRFSQLEEIALIDGTVLDNSHNGKMVTNRGASGPITLTLSDNMADGVEIHIVNVARFPIYVKGTILRKGLKIMAGSTHTFQKEAVSGNFWGEGQNNNNNRCLNPLDLDTNNRSSPVSVLASYGFADVEAGNQRSFGIDHAGYLYGWGSNSYGNLGTGNTSSVSTPKAVVGGRAFKSFHARFDGIYAIELTTGFAWSWGYNNLGQLGDNSNQNRSSPVSIVGGRSFTQIYGGSAGAYALFGDGYAYAWGYNNEGECGDNTRTHRSSPVSVVGGRQFKYLSSGKYHVVGLEKNTNLLWGWGQNGSGQLGINSTSHQSSPVSVVGGRSFAAVSCGFDHTAAIEYGTGKLFTWGYNIQGQLMDPSVTNYRTSPVEVMSGKSFYYVHCGPQVTFAIEQGTDSVWASGYRDYGNIGSGLSGWIMTPEVLNGYGPPSFSQLCLANVPCGIDAATGLGWCWGAGSGAGLGDGTSTSKSSPVLVSGGRSFSKIGAGLRGSSSHSQVAIEGSTGLLWAWGYGGYGQMGNNTSNSQNASPVSVFGGRSYSLIINGEQAHMAIEGATGNAYCWGYSYGLGAIGDGTTSNRSSPTSVQGARSFITGGGGSQNFVAIEGSTGLAWAWGSNSSGRLGDNTTTNRSSPVSVVGGRSFKQISCSDVNVFAIEGSTGYLWAWGNEGNYSIGDGLYQSRSSPISVMGGRSWAKVAAGGSASVLAIEASTGYVYGWGSTSYGFFGSFLSGTRSSPAIMSNLPTKSYTDIACYTSSFAAKTYDGTWYVWGYDQFGQIGINHATIAIVPELCKVKFAIPSIVYPSIAKDGMNWSTIEPGDSIVLASLGQGKYNLNPIYKGYDTARSNVFAVGLSQVFAKDSYTGQTYAWGENSIGQLGNNTIISASHPTAVVGGKVFSNIAVGGTSETTVVAIESSTGRLWAWGSNTYGGIGDGTGVNRSSPVSVAIATSFMSIATKGLTILGIDNSGYAWGWGSNAQGSIGDGTVLNKSSPVSVIGGLKFSAIACGYDFSAAIEQNTGYVWTWGKNNVGQLGNYSTTPSSSPGKVAGNIVFSSITCGADFAIGVEASTGKLWAWGSNTYGCVGDSSSVTRTSPVSVKSGRSFRYVYAGVNSVFAIDGATGELLSWGRNDYAQLGIGTNTSTVSEPTVVPVSTRFIAAYLSNTNAYAIEADTNIVYAWGSRINGFLGDGTSETIQKPTLAITDRSYSKISCSSGDSFYDNCLALEASTGYLWAWGFNHIYNLGLGDLENRSSPTSVLGGRSFSKICISSVNSACIEGATGYLWTCGYNYHGQLGTDNTIERSSPVSVSGTRSFKDVAVNGSCMAAIEGSTGYLWAWGNNINGCLGLDTITGKQSTPTSVVGDRSWKAIAAIGGSDVGFLALEASTGYAYAWGYGWLGGLGDGTQNSRSSPTSVLGGRSFSQLSATFGGSSYAIEGSTGYLWAWGYNSMGQLGINTTSNRSSPVSVFGGRSYSKVCATNKGCYAIEGSTGFVYGWGGHIYGICQFGQASSPTIIGGFRSFPDISAQQGSVLALDGNTGFLWSWGNRTNGLLGDGTCEVVRTPVSIGRIFS
jgi:alpha-tubulin suppressor-like RCC1 family protein